MCSLKTLSFGATISVALLAGCYGSGSSTATATTPAGAGLPNLVRTASDKQSAGLIFNSSYGGNSVDYYLKGTGPNNPVAGSLSGSFSNPQGMAVDKAGALYVTNTGDDDVLVYPTGSTSPSATLNDPNDFPEDVAVASDGTVYVANVFGPIGASGNVVAYARGASNPTKTFVDEHFRHVIGVAVDKSGNLFVSYDATPGSGSGSVVEFKGGKDKATEMHIKLGGAGGVGFDSAAHLLVIDQATPSLNVYDVGNREPVHKLTLPGSSAFFSFNKDSTRLYVADYALGEIDEFRYRPSALTQINTITNGIVPSNSNLGIATTPAQQL
jgi:hypothetical protein